MTDTTLTAIRSSGPFAGLRARLASLLEVLAEASQGMRCAREYERLSQLSDEELARRGLKRDGLVQHAFRGYISM
jgi:hypothetical protein